MYVYIIMMIYILYTTKIIVYVCIYHNIRIIVHVCIYHNIIIAYVYIIIYNRICLYTCTIMYYDTYKYYSHIRAIHNVHKPVARLKMVRGRGADGKFHSVGKARSEWKGQVHTPMCVCVCECVCV